MSFVEAPKYKRTLWRNFFICQLEKSNHLSFFLIIYFLFCQSQIMNKKQMQRFQQQIIYLQKELEKLWKLKGKEKNKTNYCTKQWLMFQNSRCLNSLWAALDVLESFGLEFSFRERIILGSRNFCQYFFLILDLKICFC